MNNKTLLFLAFIEGIALFAGVYNLVDGNTNFYSIFITVVASVALLLTILQLRQNKENYLSEDKPINYAAEEVTQ